MQDFFRYYGQVRTLGGRFTSLPAWGRFIVGVFALPGIALAALSLLMFMVSILALLLLALPVYRLLQAVTGGRHSGAISSTDTDVFDVTNITDPSPGRKQVDVRVVEGN
jgi:hypothetical protein